MGIIAALALSAAGNPGLGFSIAASTLANTLLDRNARDGIPGDSATKSINDFVDQTLGTFTQPSWLNGNSYDTHNLFYFGSSPETNSGLRINFSGGTYTSTEIAAVEDNLNPYTWNSITQKYDTNPGYSP